ncbi:MAG TPA: DUF1292 domain-containing protein [Pseudogracilibacillus sp.]|nr:DUF1292 domain-containing protein [Pseudogracilibacillus sp.]
MGQQEQERIIIPDEDGTEHVFNVLYKFDVEDTDATYVALIPVEQEESEQQDLYVFRIEEEEGDDLRLFQIEDDTEWEIIEETIATLQEDGII